MGVVEYLDKKPLFYTKIDYERMPRVYAKIEHLLSVQNVIHVVGTNGKGSTGKFLANALFSAGKSVLHYSSPHILSFNERININKKDVSDDALQEAHNFLMVHLSKNDADSLSYFEYTTLLALVLAKDVQYVVLEAGLGGEYDATNVVKKTLSIFTPISIDHQGFLGSSIEDIATTKLNSMSTIALLAPQESEIVYEIAKKISIQKKVQLYRYSELIDVKVVTSTLPPFLNDNLQVAKAAFKLLGFQDVHKHFSDLKLFGRLEKISNNVTIDVGHNEAAAKVIANFYSGKKVVLIYNTFGDKDYRA
ncbi:MAG: Mur ligase family protein, partial [Campylobacterota bacterium]|nr:Mur ligase family protein [Campylobacterota bacterium]